MIDQIHRVGVINPQQAIDFINRNYPHYDGVCVYDREKKCLKSEQPDKVYFHFDTIHGAIHVREFVN